MPSSGYATISFTAGEQPTTAKWNLVGSNDASFNNGNGFNDGIIVPRHFAANAVNQTAVDWTTTGGIWWQELGRTTLGTAGNTITVSFTAKKYLWVKFSLVPTGGTCDHGMRFNSDTGTNYNYRRSVNGTADVTGTSVAYFYYDAAVTSSSPFYGDLFIDNIASQEKVGQGFVGGAAVLGAANTANKVQYSNKWANTSAQINRIDSINTSGTGNFAIGSELIVLGHD